ncbi:hypothetical protein N7532_011032 [Penicillium argentinense]|uniref:SAP domain-containing protein n=1 Tax=Penicillium argentinense TaxID=1131581 RepID=A0A9W9JU26_9EURO|nr:uncharacterized protein N7532_011032 [Penicillium argentinense]KAJ5081989.1 hypothetical protein N7532_011032 [Penicillium argentinense]
MAAPRSTSLRVLRQLSQHSAAPARRGLHITGVQSAQPANPADKASMYAARSLPDLKLECQRRSIRAAGSKSELVERLSNHDALQTRAFSIAMRRINPNAFSETRQFNTSRSSSAVGDTSPVDFIYMPTMSEMETPSVRWTSPQIPVLPDMHSLPADTPSAPPMKPQIYTVAGSGADVAASPMSEVVDNHAVDIDPFSLTEAVGRSRVGEEMNRRTNGETSTESGVVRELWTGFLDDVLGPKQVARK